MRPITDATNLQLRMLGLGEDAIEQLRTTGTCTHEKFGKQLTVTLSNEGTATIISDEQSTEESGSEASAPVPAEDDAVADAVEGAADASGNEPGAGSDAAQALAAGLEALPPQEAVAAGEPRVAEPARSTNRTLQLLGAAVVVAGVIVWRGQAG